jgi:integrase
MLTDLKIKSLKPRTTLYRVADRLGLSIEVPPSGALRWRFRFRAGGKYKMLSLGTYPTVSVAEARKKLFAFRDQVAQGVDPSAQRQAAKKAEVEAAVAEGDTFSAIARKWMAAQDVADVTASKTRWLLETFLIPDLGELPIAGITARQLLATLRKIEETGKLETARRAKIKAGQVFRYALIEGKVEIDPTPSLRGALKSPKVKHHAAITEPAKMGELLRAIEGFSGWPTTMYALRFAPLVFVRPGELRHATWSEIDLVEAIWRIPAERMKMKAAHLVPLSRQSVSILRELHALTGSGHYLFPSIRTTHRPMSENTITAALRRLGYSGDEMTGHGFRSMAATRLNEMGWRADAIERQLAHAESNKVRDAYTSAAQYLDERKRMMQAWADYLDRLKTGADVIPILRNAN